MNPSHSSPLCRPPFFCCSRPLLSRRLLTQVSHVSTECDYPLGAEAKDMIEDEWAVSQVCVVALTEPPRSLLRRAPVKRRVWLSYTSGPRFEAALARRSTRGPYLVVILTASLRRVSAQMLEPHCFSATGRARTSVRCHGKAPSRFLRATSRVDACCRSTLCRSCVFFFLPLVPFLPLLLHETRDQNRPCLLSSAWALEHDRWHGTATCA